MIISSPTQDLKVLVLVGHRISCTETAKRLFNQVLIDLINYSGRAELDLSHRAKVGTVG